MRKWKKNSLILYNGMASALIMGAGASLFMAILTKTIENAVNEMKALIGKTDRTEYDFLFGFFVLIAFSLLILAILCRLLMPDSKKLENLVVTRLCKAKYGNPLQLKEGELIPKVKVCKENMGFKIRVSCPSVEFEKVSALENTISSCLTGKFDGYAVTAKNEDLALRYVDYFVEDVISQAKLQDVISSPEERRLSDKAYVLPIRGDIVIDYSRVMNASCIVSGRTRSGKTTAIISVFIIPVLSRGPDKYRSKVLIIDPKNAELSQCPHVLSPKLDGDVNHIMKALIEFDEIRIKRQQTVNEAGKVSGKPIKWWDIGMNPSILFIDEFVALQGLIPKKGTADNPEYNLDLFKSLIRRIATQGASAGCFLVLSTAEASVGTGGLEAVVNNACGIRFLFKPSKEEGMFLWNKERLEALRERQYDPGDAWISIDDGINNNVKLVKFPRMEFGEYAVLAELMEDYHSKEGWV